MTKITGVIALLAYEDIVKAHDFLVEAFGFTSGGIFRDADGTVRHGEVRAGDFVIWMHRVTPEHRLLSPRALAADSGGLVVRVDDVDAHCAQARAHGAKIMSEPSEKPYGQRDYSTEDTEGHRWWFATESTP